MRLPGPQPRRAKPATRPKSSAGMPKGERAKTRARHRDIQLARRTSRRSQNHPVAESDDHSHRNLRRRVVVVSDERIAREGLVLLLGREPDIEVVGETAKPQAGELVDAVRPDAVVLHVGAPSPTESAFVGALLERNPDVKLLLLTATDDGTIVRLLKAGAAGYVRHDASPADLVKAIGALERGEVWVERRLITLLREADQAIDRPRTKAMPTAREQQVLRLLAAGETNKGIAQALAISEKTVKSHLNAIFRKIKVSRRIEAALYAIQNPLGQESLG